MLAIVQMWLMAMSGTGDCHAQLNWFMTGCTIFLALQTR